MLASTPNWLSNWVEGGSVASGLAILALAVTFGLVLGAIRVRRIKLGISGVLFSALLFGQIGLTIDPKVLGFLRDFALILYMYAIGLQVGPSFVTSLKTEGMRLNLLAVAVLVLGAIMTWLVANSMQHGTVSGLFSGAFTSTAALAAAQEALRGAPGAGESAATCAGLAYSITYPFGIVGPMIVISLLRRVFRVNIKEEKDALTAAEDKRRPLLEFADIEVTRPECAGKPLKVHPMLQGNEIIFSRLLRGNVMTIPTADTEILIGDIYRAVGPRERVEQLVLAMGKRSTVDVAAATGDVQRMNLFVTRTQVLHKALHELDLTRRSGAAIVRVNRAGIDIVANGSLRLAFADRVTVVGPALGLKMVEKELGNCPDILNRSQLIPIFLGIVIGVIVGSIPIAFPGLHTPLRIGLAGGPLIAAIALSQFGSIGSIVWYMPVAANQLFRDFGLAVFLACVGLQAGDHFIQRAAQGSGLSLLLWGAAITIIPVLIVGFFARLLFRMNFITLAGWVAGAMTSTPALIFADDMTKSEAPAVAYASVAPLGSLVPIICAQILAIAIR
jgi:putative transport protein